MTIHDNALVISGKRKMLHDVSLHDVIGGFFCIWLRPSAVHVMHARFAPDEIINLLRENK